jgi:hypothetical protein
MKTLVAAIATLFFASCVQAHGTDAPPPTPAVTITPAGGQNNHNNRDDNVKHVGEVVAVTCIAGKVISGHWCFVKRDGLGFYFTGIQKSPE